MPNQSSKSKKSSDTKAGENGSARSPRRMRRRERTRAELIVAAEKLASTRSLEAVSVDEITEAADVAKGTFYTHFTDKADLIKTIGDQTRRELEDAITRLNTGIEDATLRMANGLSTMFMFAIRKPVHARAMLNLQPDMVAPDAPINAGVRRDIERGLQARQFWAPSVEAAVVMVIGAAMSAISRLSDPNRKQADLYGLAADLIATILVGLGLKPAEALHLGKTVIATRQEELNS